MLHVNNLNKWLQEAKELCKDYANMQEENFLFMLNFQVRFHYNISSVECLVKVGIGKRTERLKLYENSLHDPYTCRRFSP